MMPAYAGVNEIPRVEFGGAKSRPAAAHSTRIAVLATADGPLSRRIAAALAALRWEVRSANGGAGVLACLAQDDLSSTGAVATVIVDSWLPDLEVREFVGELCGIYPRVDVFAIDGTDLGAPAARGPYRNEVLHALRQTEEAPSGIFNEPAWSSAPRETRILDTAKVRPAMSHLAPLPGRKSDGREGASSAAREVVPSPGLMPLAFPEFIGASPAMLEVSRRIRLVAPRATPVLIEGASGTGKELVARALHRLSPRASRPFVALNCAAIPEALLESELFGHARGAFTGALESRAGRIQAAQGGTLFLDEIGELPLALQAKLLRFVECGELQRVGESEPVHVDVRIVAATHRGLARMARQGAFRADLFYRLSVFLVRTPSLSEHMADLPQLVDHFLRRMGRSEPAKTVSTAALDRLLAHDWPGNVRELEHVIERAWILAEEHPVIGADEIEFDGTESAG